MHSTCWACFTVATVVCVLHAGALCVQQLHLRGAPMRLMRVAHDECEYFHRSDHGAACFWKLAADFAMRTASCISGYCVIKLGLLLFSRHTTEPHAFAEKRCRMQHAILTTASCVTTAACFVRICPSQMTVFPINRVHPTNTSLFLASSSRSACLTTCMPT